MIWMSCEAMSTCAPRPPGAEVFRMAPRPRLLIAAIDNCPASSGSRGVGLPAAVACAAKKLLALIGVIGILPPHGLRLHHEAGAAWRCWCLRAR